MSRVSQVSQRQRTQNNPLVLGSFDETSLRVLTGTLGPKNVVVGRADTNQYSNGGFGGGSSGGGGFGGGFGGGGFSGGGSGGDW